MKIAIIGPGVSSIPPIGWGAVEILVWDYKQTLEKFGHEVHIINTSDTNQIVQQVNNINPDFVHVQYDDYYNITERFNCKNVILTSHYAYLGQLSKIGGYLPTFNGFKNSKAYIFALSKKIKDAYIKNGMDENKIFVVPNGVRDDLFNFKEQIEEEKSIYLAKIDYRKRQFIFEGIKDLYFAGNIVDPRFKRVNYLGEWSKEHLYQNLTNYANLVLLSDGEAHPLVCMEAMVSGLGLVLSEYATANLDLSKPFIDVIPENKINDFNYIESVIIENRKKSLPMRAEIRKYALDNFKWEHIVKDIYLPTVEKIFKK